MSDAKKCDRCGEFYQRWNKPREYQVRKDSNRDSTTPTVDWSELDLCDECSDSLEEWLTDG